MSSITPQIDAAVVLMRARAAEFDETKTMEGVRLDVLAMEAAGNLNHARWEMKSSRLTPVIIRDLLDTMNLCALALSLLHSDEMHRVGRLQADNAALLAEVEVLKARLHEDM